MLSVNISLGYYTTKSTKKQVNNGVFRIFVNYAHFYVNNVMLTKLTNPINLTVNSTEISRCWVAKKMKPTKY